MHDFKRLQIALLFRLHDLLSVLKLWCSLYTWRYVNDPQQKVAHCTRSQQLCHPMTLSSPQTMFCYENTPGKWNRNDAKQHMTQELFILKWKEISTASCLRDDLFWKRLFHF